MVQQWRVGLVHVKRCCAPVSMGRRQRQRTAHERAENVDDRAVSVSGRIVQRHVPVQRRRLRKAAPPPVIGQRCKQNLHNLARIGAWGDIQAPDLKVALARGKVQGCFAAEVGCGDGDLLAANQRIHARRVARGHLAP